MSDDEARRATKRRHPAKGERALKLVCSQDRPEADLSPSDAVVLPMCPTSAERLYGPLRVLTPDETAAYVAAHPEVAERARQLAVDHTDGAA